MDVKAILGSNWRDDMTVEELLAALNGVELPDASKLKASLDKVTHEAAERKQTLKTQADEIAALKEQLAALTRESAVAKHTAKFQSLGYDAEAAAKAAVALADGKLEELFTIQQQVMANALAKAQADAMAGTMTPSAGETPTGSRFFKMSLTEQMSYANQHPDDADVKAWLSGKD